MTHKEVWPHDLTVPKETIEFVDEGIIRKLPPGTTILNISPHANSYWARTAKIETLSADGKPVRYFMKVIQGPNGQHLCTAEYTSNLALHNFLPSNIALPIAHGQYLSPSWPETYFYISEFHSVTGETVSPEKVAVALSTLHKKSQEYALSVLNPTLDADSRHDTNSDPLTKQLIGLELDSSHQYGFPFRTCNGPDDLVYPLSATWTECFGEFMKRCFAAEKKSQGPDEEFEFLAKKIIEVVIPRLLMPLETAGRKIIPTLVHGDAGDGNLAVDEESGEVVMFDGAPLWAHNEFELGPWMLTRVGHKVNFPHLEEYTKHMEISEPKEDFGGRLMLYCLRYDVHSSSLYPGITFARESSRHTMRKLVDLYANNTGTATQSCPEVNIDRRWKFAVDNSTGMGTSESLLVV